MKVGVLALQGDVREHILALNECGASAQAVKTHEEISAIDALIIPGGESTTISKLSRSFNLFDLISNRISNGMPTYGSCAGLILLANKVEDAIVGQESFGGLDVVARRNAFGSQIDSFEMDLEIKGISSPKFRAIFIRAPWIESVGPHVEILAQVDGHAVAVRDGHILATSFHPELTGDNRIHRYFLDVVCKDVAKVNA
ncbi:MAG: pyridoxal 5'-phosphate synthase glutaminase subunit PdxT [Actinobacteria bacterium]|nr:pyridoxal 5'-phosphate synthase glutaminase subunit PdxT [Actinomycetota bacterium]